jgi:secreted trypsin-like serine protease
MSRFLHFTLAAITVAFIASPASAITFGFVDSNNTFSNVGAFIVKRSSDGRIFPICSGTLIAPKVFLTASHCTAFFEQDLVPRGFTAFVSFDGSIGFGSLTDLKRTELIAVTHVVTNPAFNQAQSDSGDIGALILATTPKGLSAATLPSCGLFDQLSAQNGLKDAVFTAVGYGVQNRVVGGGVGDGALEPFFQDLNPIPRMFAFSSFDALNGGYIRLSQNPATGDGGTCFGDSGGPNFFNLNGQQLLGAITITGDAVCQATNVDYRLDTVSASAFLSFVNATFGTSIPVACH